MKKYFRKILSVLKEYKRVILLTKKPDAEEISKTIKVAGAGILIIGLIGFIIQSLSQLIF